MTLHFRGNCCRQCSIRSLRNGASAVLLAMGTPREQALGAVCFSLGRWTTAEEVDQAVTFLVERLRTLRSER